VVGAALEDALEVADVGAVEEALPDDEQADTPNPRTAAAAVAVARVTATPVHLRLRRCA
jgi:hypothetical protein